MLTTPEQIPALCLEANSDPDCAGLILWMHTFSPAKMWIGGLVALQKPFVHLHTQFNRDLPWGSIDMDFMNLNQAAHGDREAGFLHTRLRLRARSSSAIGGIPRSRSGSAPGCARRAAGTIAGRRFARFGDNMRQVAVTEGDKVAAEIRFGYAVNGYGVGELAAAVDAVTTMPRSALAPSTRRGTRRARTAKGRRAARLASLRRPHRARPARVPEEGGFKGFTRPSRTCTA